MDNVNDDEYCREISTFLPSEELDKYFEEAMWVGYNSGSSSPDGAQSSPDGAQSSSSPPASKNIASERNRRKKLNERLYTLRSVVPIITKMDKASTIKDAIEYIKSLHDEERRIQAEICELESGKPSSHNNSEIFYLEASTFSNPKRTRMDNYYDSSTLTPSSPIELLELRVSSMAGRILVVSLTCIKRTDTMVKLCQMFESLNLKIITAHISVSSGRLLKTVFLEGDEEEREALSLKIKAALSDIDSGAMTI